MGSVIDYLGGSLNPINLLKSLKYKIEFRQEHPDFFDPERYYCFLWSSGKW